jgi:hypothetical protein
MSQRRGKQSNGYSEVLKRTWRDEYSNYAWQEANVTEDQVVCTRSTRLAACNELQTVCLD